MDRSYLSDQAVVAASREFVCVRVATYEDGGEAEFMSSIYRYRNGTLKNSLFAILDSNGDEHLVRAGRSPKWTFSDGAAMSEGMREVARDYPNKKAMTAKLLGLPYLKSVHVALNIAACDAQRLVIVHASKAADRDELESLLTPLAWSDELIGGFLYAKTNDASELADITDAEHEPGLLIVEPGAYGLSGRLVAFVKLGASKQSAQKTLVDASNGNAMGSKDSKRHIGRGRRQGVKWETAIEVEDPTQVGRGRRRGPRRRDR